MKSQIEEEKQKPVPEQSADKLESTVATLDKQFAEHNSKYLKVYVKTDDGGDFTEVKDFNHFPENVLETINLFYSKTGKILVFKDVPVSESGDYSNTYTHYFDDAGRTIAFKDITSFFGSDSEMEDVTITEERIKYFDAAFKQVSESHKLRDDSGKAVDSTKCTFNYRTNPEVYKSLETIPVLKKLMTK